MSEKSRETDTPVMQRANERERVAVVGMLVDGGGPCTVLAVHQRSPRRWVIYPHGVGELGVELSEEGAIELAHGIIHSTD